MLAEDYLLETNTLLLIAGPAELTALELYNDLTSLPKHTERQEDGEGEPSTEAAEDQSVANKRAHKIKKKREALQARLKEIGDGQLGSELAATPNTTEDVPATKKIKPVEADDDVDADAMEL